MKIKDGFAKRNIAGSDIVVPIGENAKEFNGMITLNETGGFLWDAEPSPVPEELFICLFISGIYSLINSTFPHWK